MVDLSFLQAIAKEAGLIIRNGFCETAKVNSNWKEDDTPVTKADIEVNDLILGRLEKYYPKVSFIGEEGSRIVEGSEWLVYCDPIDGTFPYATGMAISTLCLSVLHKGTPVTAVIYDPFSGRFYSARKGQGAFMNGQKIHVSGQRKLETKAHVHLIWWKGSTDFGPLCEKIVQTGAAWMNFCTIGIVGGLIAAGQFEASVFPGTKVWETAAMGLLVEEAGGRCTDLKGDPIDYLANGKMDGHVISNGWVHDELLDLING